MKYKEHSESETEHTKFIKKKFKEGMEPSAVVRLLTSSGWQHYSAQKAVQEAMDVPAPPDDTSLAPPPNETAQTGNTGTPVQVENVQYNMGVKPVESRIGTFLKISAVGLWLTVIFVSWFVASIIGLASDGSTDGLSGQIVFTVSLSAVSVPTFVIADRKVREELLKNNALVDDLFFKKNVRSGLNAAIGLTGISAFITIFTFLSAAFIADSDVGFLNGFQSLVFTAGFGCALLYYWRLHALTKR
ncbi:MAG: hypothetical protein R3313_01850 [Candidatus Saccharimonadales bacterium]|nr:hypothetical protein [Candidatus Saccharimonadales bacterium]